MDGLQAAAAYQQLYGSTESEMSEEQPEIEHATQERSPSIAKLAAALCKAQGQMDGAKKNSANPHFKNAYPDLESVWDACRVPLTENGIAVIQSPGTDDGQVALETMLVHNSGEYIARTLYMRPTKNDPQGVGSAITYARRYALMAMVGLAPEDDDGEAASGRGPQKPQRDFSAERNAIQQAATVDELKQAWGNMDAEARKALQQEKDQRKAELDQEEAA